MLTVRPVVKDLKETPDAVFVCWCDGYLPQSAEDLLLERAKKHIEEYRGLLKPIL